MGERRPLYKEMWSSPEAFVDTLRRFFRDNDEVLRLIDLHQYRIQDEEDSLYEPGNSRVRSGTTLYMAAILYRRFASQIHCPWCSARVPLAEGWNHQSSVSCSTCMRKFSTSNTNGALPKDAMFADPSENSSSIRDADSNNRDAASNNHDTASASSNRRFVSPIMDDAPRPSIRSRVRNAMRRRGFSALALQSLPEAPRPSPEAPRPTREAPRPLHPRNEDTPPETSSRSHISFRLLHLILMPERVKKIIQRHPEAFPILCTSNKKALLIGIRTYENPEIKGAHDDVYKMRDLLLDHYEYTSSEITILVDDRNDGHVQPTRNNILAAIYEFVKDVKGGDQLCFYYCGQSTQIPARSTNEEDGMDECLVPLDGLQMRIVNNELHHTLVRPLPAGSQLVAILDTCHSGSLLDLKHRRCNNVYVPWVWRGRRNTEEIRSRIVRRGAQVMTLSQTTGPALQTHNASTTPARAPARYSVISVVGDPPTSSATLNPLTCLRTRSMSLEWLHISSENITTSDTWILPEEEARCESPVGEWPCNGWCRDVEGRSPAMEDVDEVKADVISLASCEDSQQAWGFDGKSMTSSLVKFLEEKPESSLKDVLTYISHVGYSSALDQNAFQNPELSSPRPLNMDSRWNM
ncbi:caspase domain-containing protein [Mycena galopus ATCC 62051]|nr:caspase domain-containing protein [Mycena galopus ATCC 62051]